MYYEIEQFLLDNDPIITVNINPSTTVKMQDWFPALKRAQSHWIQGGSPDPNVNPDWYFSTRGFSVHFGPRQYYFSHSIQLIRGMSLIGSGSGDAWAGTVLIFPPGEDGIICNAAYNSASATSPSDQLGQASGSIVERLRILGNYGDVTVNGCSLNNAVCHGILAYTTLLVSKSLLKHDNWIFIFFCLDLFQRYRSNAVTCNFCIKIFFRWGRCFPRGKAFSTVYPISRIGSCTSRKLCTGCS
jgi:hypothetical protein